MKKFTINNTTITITPAGYGQYKVSNGERTIHTTSSQMYDACDDEDDMDYEYARQYFYNLFA